MIQKKKSKLIVKTETGSLIQLLPEIPTDSSLNLQSRHPVANSAVTAAVSQIEDGLLDSNIVKVTESKPTAANAADLENESMIAWLQPSDSWSVTIDTEATSAGERMGQVPLCFGNGLSGSMTVNWGDGTVEEYTPETACAGMYPEHEYETAGEYTVAVECCRFENLYIANAYMDEGEVVGPSISAHTLKSINSPLPRIGGVYDLMSSGTFVDGSISGAWCGYGKLESIPEDLFAGNPEIKSFKSTFAGCTSLTSIPENLFAGNVNAESFEQCFNGCTGLAGFTLRIGSSNVANCGNFVQPQTAEGDRIVYVPAPSATYDSFLAVRDSLGLILRTVGNPTT